jgi:hypothetical protein
MDSANFHGNCRHAQPERDDGKVADEVGVHVVARYVEDLLKNRDGDQTQKLFSRTFGVW